MSDEYDSYDDEFEKESEEEEGVVAAPEPPPAEEEKKKKKKKKDKKDKKKAKKEKEEEEVVSRPVSRPSTAGRPSSARQHSRGVGGSGGFTDEEGDDEVAFVMNHSRAGAEPTDRPGTATRRLSSKKSRRSSAGSNKAPIPPAPKPPETPLYTDSDDDDADDALIAQLKQNLADMQHETQRQEEVLSSIQKQESEMTDFSYPSRQGSLSQTPSQSTVDTPKKKKKGKKDKKKKKDKKEKAVMNGTVKSDDYQDDYTPPDEEIDVKKGAEAEKKMNGTVKSNEYQDDYTPPEEELDEEEEKAKVEMEKEKEEAKRKQEEAERQQEREKKEEEEKARLKEESQRRLLQEKLTALSESEEAHRDKIHTDFEKTLADIKPTMDKEREKAASPPRRPSVTIAAPEEKRIPSATSASPVSHVSKGSSEDRERVMESRIKHLEQLLEEERERASRAEERAKRKMVPQRPASAPSRRTGQSAALVRRAENNTAMPNSVHVLRGKGGTVPSKRERHSAMLYGANIFYFGGRQGRNLELDHQVYALNVNNATWKKIQTTGMRPHAGRYGHTATLWHGRLPWSDPDEPVTCSMIIFGGYGPNLHQCDGNGYPASRASSPKGSNGDVSPLSLNRLTSSMAYCTDVLTLDLETKKWTRVPKEVILDPSLFQNPKKIPKRDLTAVKNHSAVLYERRLWVFGGHREGGVSSGLDTLHLKKMKWVPIKKQETGGVRPHGLVNHTAVVWCDAMWVFGGKNSDGDQSEELWSYTFNTGTWNKKPATGDAPAVSGHAAAVHYDEMVVFGGSTGLLEYSSQCYVLNLGTLVWRRVDLALPAGLLGRQNCTLNLFPSRNARSTSLEQTDDEDATPHDLATLSCRGFVFGGAGESDHSTYAANQYHTTNDLVILDFAGGYPHTNKCETHRPPALNDPLSVTPDHSAVAVGRPLSVQLPMRYARSEPWRIDTAFDPVAPMASARSERRLTADEIQRVSERLHTQSAALRDKKIEELRSRLCTTVKTKKMTKEEVDKAVDRMYTQQLQIAKRRQSLLSKKFLEAKAAGGKLDAARIEASVERLHRQAIAHRNATMDKLAQQQVSHGPATKKLSKEDHDKVNKDLYYERVAITKSKREALMLKYLKQGQNAKQLSRAEEAAVTDRLFKGEAFVSQ